MSYLNKPHSTAPSEERFTKSAEIGSDGQRQFHEIRSTKGILADVEYRGMGAEAKKPETSQVEQAVIRLASLTSTLHSCLDRLHEKMRPVLRPVPGTEELCDKECGGHAPLVVDLLDIGDRIETAIDMLRSMEDLAEL